MGWTTWAWNVPELRRTFGSPLVVGPSPDELDPFFQRRWVELLSRKWVTRGKHDTCTHLLRYFETAGAVSISR